MQTLTINGTELGIKEYNGQRVVTFRDIDKVHKRPDTTARNAFRRNRKHFIEGKDFFLPKGWKESDQGGERKTLRGLDKLNGGRGNNTPPLEDEPNQAEITGVDEIRPSLASPCGITLLTETGYLMLVKTFNDDLAWAIQRELVNCYFKVHQPIVPVTQPPYEKPVPLSSPKKRVCDIPDNLEAQKIISELKRYRDAMGIIIEGYNRYLDEDEIKGFQSAIYFVTGELISNAYRLTKLPVNLIEK